MIRRLSRTSERPRVDKITNQPYWDWFAVSKIGSPAEKRYDISYRIFYERGGSLHMDIIVILSST